MAAQGLFQPVLAPQRVVLGAQNHVGSPGVHRQNHPHQGGNGRSQRRHQFVGMGQFFPVDNEAAQHFPGLVGAQIQVAHQPLPRLFLVGGDAVLFHPVCHHLAAQAVHLGLEVTVGNVNDLVGAGAVVADAVPAHRKLYLIAVALGVFCPVNGGHRQVQTAQAVEGVLHPLALGVQFLLIGHVAELTASALAVVGAVRLDAGGGWGVQRGNVGPGGVVAHVLDAYVCLFASDRSVDKDYHAVNAGHSGAVAGIAFNMCGVNLPFLQCHGGHLPSAAAWAACCLCSL